MYLGIDLGTSGIKVVLIDKNQNIIASSKASLEVQRKFPKWSEQNPSDWIDALESAIAQLKKTNSNELKLVKGIGLSGQMHGATLIDKDDKILRPCILWNDTRSFKEAQELDSIKEFREITGNIVFPGFTAPKLLWVKNNEPEVFEKVFKVLLPKDFLRLYITGKYVSEMSDSAGTSWLDTKNRCWSETLLEKTGLGIEHMPELVEGVDNSAFVKSEIASKWGLSENVIVAGGAGDNVATAIAAGTVNKGDSFVSLGTSGVLFSSIEEYLPNAQSAVHTFCHAFDNQWHQMGVILSATSCLEWFAKVNNISVQELSNELDESLNAPGSAIFLPYLSGERTPHNDAKIQGVFAGLTHNCSRKDLTQAILEGVSFALKDNLKALEIAGGEVKRVTILGGGSNSKYWLELMATVLNVPVDIPKESDFGAAFGAARLGLIASENENVFDVCKAPQIEKTIYPNEKFLNDFEVVYEKFRKLYPTISSVLE